MRSGYGISVKRKNRIMSENGEPVTICNGFFRLYPNGVIIIKCIELIPERDYYNGHEHNRRLYKRKGKRGWQMNILKAEKSDLAEILQVQKAAFRKEAEEFNDFNIEPMTQTVSILEEEYKTYTFLKVLNEKGQIIASIRGHIEDGTSYIGKTFVHPDYQGKGIGTQMIQVLEQMNEAPRYEINASIRCPQNIRLYERLGYVRFKKIRTENNGFVYLEKL